MATGEPGTAGGLAPCGCAGRKCNLQRSAVRAWRPGAAPSSPLLPLACRHEPCHRCQISPPPLSPPHHHHHTHAHILIHLLPLTPWGLLRCYLPCMAKLKHGRNCDEFDDGAAADFGKRDLPPQLRGRFTELWVAEPESREELCSIAAAYLADAVPNPPLGAIVDFYIDAKAEAVCTQSCRPCRYDCLLFVHLLWSPSLRCLGNWGKQVVVSSWCSMLMN